MATTKKPKSPTKQTPAKAAGKTASRKAPAAKPAPKKRATRVTASEFDSADGNGALVVVESPTKAKSIGKYLGRGYEVKATIGHIRDLPRKSVV